jgi:hypothetical protein
LGRELFANRHAKFHQLIAIECAIVVVIEELEQFFFRFRITLMAGPLTTRRRRIAVFAWAFGRLSQRRNC